MLSKKEINELADYRYEQRVAERLLDPLLGSKNRIPVVICNDPVGLDVSAIKRNLARGAAVADVEFAQHLADKFKSSQAEELDNIHDLVIQALAKLDEIITSGLFKETDFQDTVVDLRQLLLFIEASSSEAE